jgi:hypothetical protein
MHFVLLCIAGSIYIYIFEEQSLEVYVGVMDILPNHDHFIYSFMDFSQVDICTLSKQ